MFLLKSLSVPRVPPIIEPTVPFSGGNPLDYHQREELKNESPLVEQIEEFARRGWRTVRGAGRFERSYRLTKADFPLFETAQRKGYLSGRFSSALASLWCLYCEARRWPCVSIRVAKWKRYALVAYDMEYGLAERPCVIGEAETDLLVQLYHQLTPLSAANERHSWWSGGGAHWGCYLPASAAEEYATRALAIMRPLVEVQVEAQRARAAKMAKPESRPLRHRRGAIEGLVPVRAQTSQDGAEARESGMSTRDWLIQQWLSRRGITWR